MWKRFLLAAVAATALWVGTSSEASAFGHHRHRNQCCDPCGGSHGNQGYHHSSYGSYGSYRPSYGYGNSWGSYGYGSPYSSNYGSGYGYRNGYGTNIGVWGTTPLYGVRSGVNAVIGGW